MLLATGADAARMLQRPAILISNKPGLMRRIGDSPPQRTRG